MIHKHLIQVVILLQLCFLFQIIYSEETEQEKQYTVLISANIIGPFAGLYSADLEFKIDKNSSLRWGLSYINPILIPFKNLISTEISIKMPDLTIKTYNADFYALNTFLQYDLYLYKFPNSFYLGFGAEYQLLNIQDQINSSASGYYHNVNPFILLGLQAVNDIVLYRVEVGADYVFPIVNIDNLLTYYMLESSKAKGFKFFFNFAIGLGF